MTDKNCLAPSTLKCINKDFRNYYKKKTANNIKKRLHEYDNDRIIQLFLRKMANYLVEYRAGIFIDKIGYFFVYKHPFKFAPSLTRNHLKPYMLTFIPTENSMFRYWSMDFKFNRNLRARMEKNVKSGYRYLNLMNGVSKKEYMYIGAVPNVLRDKKIDDNI
jgi:hypothetical protein